MTYTCHYVFMYCLLRAADHVPIYWHGHGSVSGQASGYGYCHCMPIAVSLARAHLAKTISRQARSATASESPEILVVFSVV